MKLQDWLFAYSDAEELYDHIAAQLPIGSDKNIQDILRKLVLQYCRRRNNNEVPRSVRVEWITAATIFRKPWINSRLTSKYMRMIHTSHPLAQPPPAPTWIQLSWREGLQHYRLMRNCNVQVRPSVQNRDRSPQTRRPTNEDA